MMKEKDYRKQIGEKLEEAYLSQQIGETPSKETFQKWIEIAEQKRAERRRHRRRMASCAAALIMCVCLGVACIFKPPQVAAGGKGGGRIDQTLETNDIYTSQDELPDDVKEEFLMFPEIPYTYELVEIKAEGVQGMQTLSYLYQNENKEEIFILEVNGTKDESILNFTDSRLEETLSDGTDIYVKNYSNGEKEAVYSFEYQNLIIKINASNQVTKEEVLDMIKKAVLK